MQLQLRCIRSQSHVLNNLGGNIFQLLQVDTRPMYRFHFGRISEFCSSRKVGMKLKHLAYHGGRKGTGSLGDNGLSNPIQQENVRLAITKALRLNYSISGSKISRC